jgi:NNP family nitrate/nitrite transporter-like MFS transporter
MDKNASRALLFSTMAFAANFSVWLLYAVLGIQLQTQLSLSATQLGLFFAAPMFSGAVIRIPIGILVDHWSPKKCFILQMLVVIPALLLLPFASSFQHYLILGLWLGISGSSFIIGIRYINDWFPRAHQGTAMGVFGVGNAGAAITLALAPIIIERWGQAALGPIYAAGLLLTTLIFAGFAPEPRQTKKPSKTNAPTPPRFNLRILRFGLYYYFVFGSFLALILWLPQYYLKAYDLSVREAMAFTIFFVASSSMVRAPGGWIADRFGGRAVNWSVFWICLVCLFFLSYPPTTMTIHGIHRDVVLNIEINVWVFSALMTVIGIAQGFGRASVYKTIHEYYPEHMGSVGGLVAALGALGGCTLPIAFGFAEDLTGIHSASFMLLYGVLALCMLAMFFANKSDRQLRRLRTALDHNFLDQD